MGPKKHVFKLHERRQAMKKLEIKLNNHNSINMGKNESPSDFLFVRRKGFLVSPVSTLDFWSRVSPTSHGGSENLRSPAEEEEERVIAEKGFYLHRSPLSTPRGGAEPELLTLFPLTSPRESDEHN
ncbi:hypothetical protein COLO4_11894 [Corchorus olitorius]|uniref:Uncharacterized protein n=1 Tax=Corchorus olitorius TaxID=93759 RepID=A0A1R3K2X2_9ROSI|nr:hypothetical protein COLO4_11894 [Corchorus olitorius]